jgi:hypothetical protein
MSEAHDTLWPVDKPGVLDGIDDIPWRELSHAYGSADDVSALLRALLAQDPAEVDEAADALWSSICHQGSVYSATPYAVPFLARMAAAGLRPAMALQLLGAIGESEDDRGLQVPGSARAAVAAQIGLLAPLLGDPDDEVRRTAIWALAQSQEPGQLVQLLGERWETETDPLVQVYIIKALSVLAPAAAASIATDVLKRSAGVLTGSAGARLRLIAVRACVAAGQPWSDRLHAAATAWMADGEVLPGYWWGGDSELFGELVRALAGQGRSDAALGLVITGLTWPMPSKVPQRAIWTAGGLAEVYRIPFPALVRELAALAAEDNDVGLSAVSLLHKLGDASAGADRLAPVAGAPGPSRRADTALACLIDIDDPRAARLLARGLRDRPFALTAAAERARSQQLPFDPVLLDAVRDRLRAQDMGDGLPKLLSLLQAWGPPAEPAIPELLDLLPSHLEDVVGVLAAIGAAIPAVVHALTQAAPTGPVARRLRAAAALRSLTGDDRPLLAAVEQGLSQPGTERHLSVHAIRTLGISTERLAPALTAALDATRPDGTSAEIYRRIQLAVALWQQTGDATPAIPVLSNALRTTPGPGPGPGQFGPGLHAADAAAVLGPAARPLLPAIVPLLENPDQCSAAAQALLRIDPRALGGVSLTALADRLTDAVADPYGRTTERALAALAEIGATHLPPQTVRRLRRLAEQDERIIRFGIMTHTIRADENLRAAIEQLLEKI